jgi:hypothetical protein
VEKEVTLSRGTATAATDTDSIIGMKIPLTKNLLYLQLLPLSLTNFNRKLLHYNIKNSGLGNNIG